MNRFGRTILTLVAAALVVPAALEAQQDSRYTRDANRYLALALTRQNDAERRQLYEQAKGALTEGLEREPENAQLYLLLGQAEAGLMNFAAADAAFSRAVEMHPAYAEEVTLEREGAWITAFQAGVEAMNAQDYEAALGHLESANLIYPDRPEAYMNLGSLYAHFDRHADAEQAMRDALDRLQGPMLAELDEEQQEQWRGYRQMTTINLAQLLGGRGVDEFQAERFGEAADAFREATEVNPHSRDYWFNLAQALFARSNQLREERSASPERAEEIDRQLSDVYARLQDAAEHYGAFDPANDNLYLLIAQAHRGRAEIAPEAERQQWQQRALAALEQHDALQFALDEINIAMEDEERVRIRGVVRNIKAAPGTELRLRVSLLSIDGATLAEEVVTVSAPEADGTAEFTTSASIAGEIAGWKYEIVG